jgi:hypothetical protein
MKALIFQSLFSILLLPQLLWAQTFVVTSSSSCGPGSFAEAIDYANSTPGKDRIQFDPGLREIRVLYCPAPPPMTPSIGSSRKQPNPWILSELMILIPRLPQRSA